MRSSVESLPNINRTITYTIRTVGSAPSGAGAGTSAGQAGMTAVFFDGGGEAMGIGGRGSDGYLNSTQRAIVGETNDERVTRTGLRTGKVTSEIVTGMRTISNLGMHEPELLQVVPTKGHYAQRYQEEIGDGMAGGRVFPQIRYILGGIGKAIKRFFATGTDGPTTAKPTAAELEIAKWGEYDQGQIQTSGSSSAWEGANQNPNTWHVAKMTSGNNKWKVVDDKGKNIATGFGAEDSARGYLEDKKAGKGYNDLNSPYFVTPMGEWKHPPSSGGGGTGGGTGGGGTGPPAGWQSKTYQRNTNDR